MLRSSFSRFAQHHNLVSLIPRCSAIASRHMGEVAAVPEGTISSKTGLPVSSRPPPKAAQDYMYHDRTDVPIPVVPFIEFPNAEQQALLELQKKDWKEISNEDKRLIYNLKFQWSMDDLRHLSQNNNYNIAWTVLIFLGAALVTYEILGIYMWERSRRPALFTEPRMTTFRCKIKKFMNKVGDVVSPQYLEMKKKETEIDGVEL
ncbi:uncharacterized protein LOC142340186 [Convolutriloba macropyga]|uniref:uncharacterized protein LOC142340186 n=1 Tax=Convolutriloba macropyga TaxID=536237 RepID=UPI003F5247C4